MKKMFKSLLLELNWINELDVNNVVNDEGLMCIEGLISWNEIEEMDVNECKEFIKCNVFSDYEIDV